MTTLRYFQQKLKINLDGEKSLQFLVQNHSWNLQQPDGYFTDRTLISRYCLHCRLSGQYNYKKKKLKVLSNENEEGLKEGSNDQ
jgi:hypothetical protein